jgi:uncharacterized protein
MVWFRPANQVNRMFLSVKEMEVRKVRFDVTLPPGEIDFAGEDLVQLTALEAIGEAELLEETDGQLRIQGRYTVEMEAECDRCLCRARFPLDQTFDLFYQPTAALKRVDEVEIDTLEAEIGFYLGDGIELEDILLEQVLLALPMQKTCSEECRGICPECGANRNEGDCKCAPKPADNRWGALRDLK